MSYSEDFTTPFCFYDVKTRHCRTQDQKVINLEVSPKAALDDIEIFVSENRKSDFAAACLSDKKNPG